MKINDADFKTLVMSAGIVEPAVSSARLKFDDETGGSVDVSVVGWIESVKASGESPHWWPNTYEKDIIDPKLVEAACGAKPTLAARAGLRKTAGPALYAEILGDWGASPSTLTPGKNPKASDNSGAKKATPRDHSNNPFHRSQWNISKQGELVKRLGLDKANAIAKSVGSHVGATRANADY